MSPPAQAAVGPLVGGEHKLASNTKAGLMEVADEAFAAEAIAVAVAQTGMRAEHWPSDENALRFVVCGLDCQNTVRGEELD